MEHLINSIFLILISLFILHTVLFSTVKKYISYLSVIGIGLILIFMRTFIGIWYSISFILVGLLWIRFLVQYGVSRKDINNYLEL